MNGDRPDDRLDLWKDIASYLNRGVSTVQRWEKREGMPVHRHVHDKMGSVYAYKSELDLWWAGRGAHLGAEEEAPSPAARRSGRLTPPVAVAFGAGVAAALLIAAVVSAVRTPADAATGIIRFRIPAPEGTTWDSAPGEPNPAVAPDGRLMAFLARDRAGVVRVWVQSLDQLTPRALPGTEGAGPPFWSPDGRFVGFFADAKLKKVRVDGGPAETISDLSGARAAGRGSPSGSGTWSRGQILFAQSGGLWIVSAAGGTPVAVTTIDAGRDETAHRYPQFLPDGRRFLFTISASQPGHRGIFLASLDSPTRVRLSDADSNAAYAASGRVLLFVRNATLTAQRIDPERGSAIGDPLPLAGGVLPGPTARVAPFSVAANVLAYRTGGVIETQLVRVDRTGRVLGTIGPPGPYPANPSLSPDGTHLAMALFDLESGGSDIWLFDLDRGVRSRFTFDPALELAPLWAADGTRILFASNRAGPWDIHERRVDAAAAAEAADERPLIQSGTNKYPQAMSADGAMLVFTRRLPQTNEDLWVRDGNGEEAVYLQTPFDEREAQLSPDGRWMAYSSNESGEPEVYVRPFPAAAGVWKVSVDGGAEPRWRDDGRELYYVGPDRRLMAVPVGGDATFSPGLPSALFDLEIAQTLWWDYVVMPGGSEFVVKQATSTAASSPLTVVMNWEAALPRD